MKASKAVYGILFSKVCEGFWKVESDQKETLQTFRKIPEMVVEIVQELMRHVPRRLRVTEV